MIVKPSVAELLKKSKNRFELVIATSKRARKITELYGEDAEVDSAEAFIVSTVDTAIMAQNIMVAAESLGLGGVYIGGIRDNPSYL